MFKLFCETLIVIYESFSKMPIQLLTIVVSGLKENHICGHKCLFQETSDSLQTSLNFRL